MSKHTQVGFRRSQGLVGSEHYILSSNEESECYVSLALLYLTEIPPPCAAQSASVSCNHLKYPLREGREIEMAMRDKCEEMPKFPT